METKTKQVLFLAKKLFLSTSLLVTSVLASLKLMNAEEVADEMIKNDDFKQDHELYGHEKVKNSTKHRCTICKIAK